MCKAHSVRKLKRTCTEFMESKGTSMTKPKTILAGILAIDSIDMHGAPFKRYLDSDDRHELQFGCCCKSSFFYKNGELKVDSSDCSVIWFLYKHLSELQHIGTVPAIDYDSYLRHFNTDL